MSLTRRSIADQIDRLDEEISELQKDKAEIYAAYREQLEKDGIAKSQIKIEATALKAAIRRRREISIDEQATSDRDALIEEIVTEIRSALVGTVHASRNPPRARAREKLRPEEYQEPRLAPLAEVKEAHRNGNPISNDTAYRNAAVYFAECPTTGRLKIGISNNVEERLESLRQNSGLPLTLLATLPGTRQEELRALEAFASWRVEGEWHVFTAPCRAFLDRYVADQSVSSAPRASETPDGLDIPESLRR